VAKEELGTKRVCPDTGKKFYDLNKDPVVSPYTGKSYPLTYFQEVPVSVKKEAAAPAEEEEAETEEVEEEAEDGPEFVSLEDADEDGDDADDAEEDLPEIPDVDIEVEDDEADDEAFLEDEEEEDDLSDMLGGVDGEEEQ
jgi:uncharacterized protein (TIGR02300 family)